MRFDEEVIVPDFNLFVFLQPELDDEISRLLASWHTVTLPFKDESLSIPHAWLYGNIQFRFPLDDLLTLALFTPLLLPHFESFSLASGAIDVICANVAASHALQLCLAPCPLAFDAILRFAAWPSSFALTGGAKDIT